MQSHVVILGIGVLNNCRSFLEWGAITDLLSKAMFLCFPNVIKRTPRVYLVLKKTLKEVFSVYKLNDKGLFIH